MDIWKFFGVGHRNHTFCNPMSGAKFDELIERLALPERARVLDIASGKAEMLVRVAERWACSGIGVDQSPPFVEEARARIAGAGLSDRIEIVEAEGSGAVEFYITLLSRVGLHEAHGVEHGGQVLLLDDVDELRPLRVVGPNRLGGVGRRSGLRLASTGSAGTEQKESEGEGALLHVEILI